MTTPRGTEDVGYVLDRLDAIVARCHEVGSPRGYFAALYRKVTAEVDAEIRAGAFDDPVRMARLDVVFAQRYLDADAAWDADADLTRSWRVAFAAADRPRLLVVQQLLVGINAHINLDLGIAAAQVAPGSQLVGMRDDFDRINAILAAAMGEVQRCLREISPWLGLLDRLGGGHDDAFVRFSLTAARTAAWRFAQQLAPLPASRVATAIDDRDARVADLADLALRPRHLAPLVWLVGLREDRDVRRNLDVLVAAPEPERADVDRRLAGAR